jgi:hypothetical protein
MPADKSTVPVKKVQSFVKKELSGLKADAKRLEDFLNTLKAGPERASIKVCDCCIKVE